MKTVLNLDDGPQKEKTVLTSHLGSSFKRSSSSLYMVSLCSIASAEGSWVSALAVSVEAMKKTVPYPMLTETQLGSRQKMDTGLCSKPGLELVMEYTTEYADLLDHKYFNELS